MHFIILQTDATQEAESFFDSPWWDFTTLMTKAVLVALWLALVYWTYKDAKRRITDPLMIGIAVATSFIFPYLGTLFYAILRPPEYLDDVRERELEIQARQLEMGGIVSRCPACQGPIRDDYLLCPSCRHQLKVACGNCGRPLDPTWRTCPFCATDPRTPDAGKAGEEGEDIFP